MNVFYFFLILGRLCFAAEKISNFLASTRPALEEIESLCTKNFCSDKLKFHDIKYTTQMTFDIYLIKQWCTENVVILTYFLDLQLYRFCYYTRTTDPLVEKLPCLVSIGFLPKKLHVDLLWKRHVTFEKMVERLQKKERVIGDKMVRLLKACIAALELSLDNLPAAEKTEELQNYISTVLNMADIHSAFFYNSYSGTSLAFLKEMMQEDQLYHRLIFDQMPMTVVLEEFVPKTSVLPAYFYIRRDALFKDNPDYVLPMMEKARHALYLRSMFGVVMALDLHISKFAQKLEIEFQNVDNLLVALNEKKNFLLQEFEKNPSENWPGCQLIRGFAFFVGYQMNSKDSLPVSASTIVEGARMILSCLPQSDSSNLDGFRRANAKDAMTAKYDETFLESFNKTADTIEDMMLASKYITPKNIAMVKTVMEIMALSMASCSRMVKTGMMTHEDITDEGQIIIRNLTQHLILRNQNQGHFKGKKLAELDDHIRGFIISERKRLGLPFPEDRNVEQLAESVMKAGNPTKEPVSVPVVPKKKKPAKKNKTKKFQKQVPVPENNWDSFDEEELEATQEVDPSPVDELKTSEQPASSTDDTPESSDETEELPAVQITTASTLHYELLIDREDVELLDKVNAKDLAHAYLLIGNKIYKSLLRPFLSELERHDIFLFAVFRRSMKDFYTEVRMLQLRNRLVLESALTVSGIGNMSNFSQCIRFYERRLAVAHPCIINDITERKVILSESLKSLGGSIHSRHGLGKILIEKHTKPFGELDINFCEPIPCDKSYELSVLLISEYLKNDSLARACGGTEKLLIRELRGTVAHREPTINELESCINLFKGHPTAHNFLTNMYCN